MKKEKFSLTADLVSVESEPITDVLPAQKQRKTDVTDIKEQLSVRVSKSLKMDFQMWCLQNGLTMTEVFEEFIKNKLGIK